jgi:hypothetical protein
VNMRVYLGKRRSEWSWWGNGKSVLACERRRGRINRGYVSIDVSCVAETIYITCARVVACM